MAEEIEGVHERLPGAYGEEFHRRYTTADMQGEPPTEKREHGSMAAMGLARKLELHAQLVAVFA